MRLLLTLIVFALVSCYREHHALNEPLLNNLPNSDVLIQFSQTDGFSNLNAVRAQLSEEQKNTLDASLGWYATDADHGLERLHGRPAHEVVDLASCLKVKGPEEEASCFE